MEERILKKSTLLFITLLLTLSASGCADKNSDPGTPAPSPDEQPAAQSSEDSRLPDYEGCILFLHVDGDYYYVGPELHFNEYVLFGDNGQPWMRGSDNPVFDIIDAYYAGKDTFPEVDSDAVFAGFPYSPPTPDYEYSLYFEVQPCMIPEAELAGVKEALTTDELPFVFKNSATGETVTVRKPLPLLELDLEN